ncbi:MAG: hypothetical protein K6C36_09795 [Clostridia bacterium]|nr:hypothetical protein [Clostridia bacterium]
MPFDIVRELPPGAPRPVMLPVYGTAGVKGRCLFELSRALPSGGELFFTLPDSVLYGSAGAFGAVVEAVGEFLNDCDASLTLVVGPRALPDPSGGLFGELDGFINRRSRPRLFRPFGRPDAAPAPARAKRPSPGAFARRKTEFPAEEELAETAQLAEATAAEPEDGARGSSAPQAFFSLSAPDHAKPRRVSEELYALEESRAGDEDRFPQAIPIPDDSAPRAKKRSLDDLKKVVKRTWQETLFDLIDSKGYTDAEVYKRANFDRRRFSKIRGNVDYRPKKQTALAFALALRLNLDETRDFLGKAGYALSDAIRSDLIAEYFIERGVYDVNLINIALFEHGEPLLGG